MGLWQGSAPRIYTKSLQGQQIERREIQEYPNRTFEDAIYEKRKHADNKAAGRYCTAK